VVLYNHSHIRLYDVVLSLAKARELQRPPLIGEVSAKILQIEGVMWSAQRIPTAVNPGLLDPSRYSVILTRLSGPRYRPTNSRKIW
jgi:hypothetical protein